jgi:hypothetical protein
MRMNRCCKSQGGPGASGRFRRGLGRLALLAGVVVAATGVAGAWSARGVVFEVNRGQTAPEVRFLGRGVGCTVWLTAEEAVLALEAGARARRGEGGAAREREVVRMRWVGVRRDVALVGGEALPGRSNYLLGEGPASWVTDVPQVGRVRYVGVYEGIDAELYGGEAGLEYDLHVAPGADPRVVRLEFEGVREVRLNPAGEAELVLTHGTLVQRRPVAYQVVEGRRQAVEVAFVVHGRHGLGFRVGSYDPRAELVIDPVLNYSSYLGGSGDDRALGVAMDAAGNVYLVGTTNSSNFPLRGALQSAPGGSDEAFVTKINAAGTDLVYSTFLGGSGNDRAESVAVDSAGNVYLVGTTQSTNFPRSNASQNSYGGNSDAFAAKLNANGNALLFSTYLGGSSYDVGFDVAADGSGALFAVGYTESTNFPVANPFRATQSGDRDAFVSKFSSSGALVYSTYLGGSNRDEGWGVAVGSGGEAFVVGYTASSNFPVANAFRPTFGGGSYDAFFVKLTASGNTATTATFLGGSSDDYATAVAVDSAGQAHVVGYTWSSDFPVANAAQSSRAGARDGFVVKFTAAATSLAYGTYLGGTDNDYVHDVALTAGGQAVAVGETASSSFPTHQGHQSSYGGGSSDAFVTVVSPSGNAFEYSTFLGGSQQDLAWSVAYGGGNAVVVGQTASSNFPVANAYRSTFAGGANDAFLARVNLGSSYPYRYWIPSASRGSGAGGSQWRTDLGILNLNGARNDVELAFYATSGVVTSTTYVAASSQAILVDVVGQLGASGNGALEVRTTLPAKVSSRTYNLNVASAACYPNATLGQNLDAFTEQQQLASGEVAVLPQLVENASYRTNIALTNASAASATVKVELFDGSGTKLGEYTESLPAGQFRQKTRPFYNNASPQQTNMSRGYAKVTVLSGGGILAYASVIDNVTQDPTTVIMQR